MSPRHGDDRLSGGGLHDHAARDHVQPALDPDALLSVADRAMPRAATGRCPAACRQERNRDTTARPADLVAACTGMIRKLWVGIAVSTRLVKMLNSRSGIIVFMVLVATRKLKRTGRLRCLHVGPGESYHGTDQCNQTRRLRASRLPGQLFRYTWEKRRFCRDFSRSRANLSWSLVSRAPGTRARGPHSFAPRVDDPVSPGHFVGGRAKSSKARPRRRTKYPRCRNSRANPPGRNLWRQPPAAT